MDVEDVVTLYTDMDAAKLPVLLFTAGNLKRIPPFALGATDFCALAMSVNLLQSQLTDLQSKFAALTTEQPKVCLLYTSPSPRDGLLSRMPSSA